LKIQTLNDPDANLTPLNLLEVVAYRSSEVSFKNKLN